MPVTRRRQQSNVAHKETNNVKENGDVSRLENPQRLPRHDSRSSRLLQQMEPNLRQDEVDLKPVITRPSRKRNRADHSSSEGSPPPQKLSQPSKVLKSESTDDTSENDMEENEEEEFSYEKLREENMKANAEFFAQLGILEAKQSLSEAHEKPRKPTQRGLKREKISVEPLPRRRSLRIQNVGPPKPVYIPEELAAAAPDEHPRLPSGPLEMCERLIDQLEPSVHDDFITLMRGSFDKTMDIKPLSTNLKSFLKDFSKITMTEDRVAKVVKDRIFSMAIHPTTEKVLVAAGDKWGKVGFWDVLSSNAQDGVVAYCPHSRPVNCLSLPDWDPLKMYSCSYDGTLRRGDFEKGVFDEIYSSPEDEDILLRNFDFHSEHVLLVSQTDGCVGLIDTRTKDTSAEHLYPCHMKYLRTVSLHPVEKNYFVTSSVDTTIRLWDLRKMSEKKNTPIGESRHGKSVDSAYFSPLTGKYILTASADNTLNIFDSSCLKKGQTLKKRITHNNHVGRWLTKFRATWHPAREDMFVVGSMMRPRQIDIYNDDCQQVEVFKSDYLGSVCSLNVIHPSRNILAGGNSSGRVHVFM